MEKKIEISEPTITQPLNWHSLIRVDGIIVFKVFGDSSEQAQANARIAASGYLVEELVEALKEARKELEYHNWQNTNTYNKIIKLIK